MRQSDGGSGGSRMGFIDGTWGSWRASVGEVDILLRAICNRQQKKTDQTERGTNHGGGETGPNPGETAGHVDREGR